MSFNLIRIKLGAFRNQRLVISLVVSNQTLGENLINKI